MPPEIESGSFAADSVTRLLERLAYQVNAAVHSQGEETIHDLRVAVRRFNQSLAVFQDLYGAKELKKIRRRLKRMMDLTSEIRDCDVALELLEKSELPGAAPMAQKLSERRKEGVRMLLPGLRGWAARRTTARWRAALTPNGASHTPLADMVRKRLPRIGKKFVKDCERADSATQLHKARIAGKKLRYSVELIQPAYDGSLDDAIERVKGLQTLLGKVHDCHATRALVEDAGGDADLESWLKKRQKKKIREFRDGWPEAETGLREALRTLKHPARKPVAKAPAKAPAKTQTA